VFVSLAVVYKAFAMNEDGCKSKCSGDVSSCSEDSQCDAKSNPELDASFAAELTEAGYLDYSKVPSYDFHNDPLCDASVKIQLGARALADILGHPVPHGARLDARAGLCGCAHDPNSENRIYRWICTEGSTGIISQKEIYENHPDMRPLVLTVGLLYESGAITVSAHKQSGEEVPAFHHHGKSAWDNFKEMKSHFARILCHDRSGLVLLTSEGACLHNYEIFAIHYRSLRQESYKKMVASDG
jgi:hypothetical protein